MVDLIPIVRVALGEAVCTLTYLNHGLVGCSWAQDSKLIVRKGGKTENCQKNDIKHIYHATK